MPTGDDTQAAGALVDTDGRPGPALPGGSGTTQLTELARSAVMGRSLTCRDSSSSALLGGIVEA
jgi:hypothetical protein